MFLTTLALGLTVAGLLYLSMVWNFNYWRKRRVPGPKPKIFTGNYPNMYAMKRNVIYDLNDIYVWVEPEPKHKTWYYFD